MRQRLPLLVLASVLLASASAADAAPGGLFRRWRGPSAPTPAFGPVKSDESLEAAIARTPAGGIANLPSGAFRSALTIDRPMTLLASSLGTVIDAAGLGRPAIEIAAGVRGVVVYGVTLRNADGDGLVARGDNDRLVLRRTTIASCGGRGAFIAPSASVLVDQCSFAGNRGDQLDLDGDDARVSRTLFSHGSGCAVVLRGDDTILDGCRFDGGVEGIVFAGKRQAASRSAVDRTALAVRFAPTSDACRFERNEVSAVGRVAVTDVGSAYGSIRANRVRGCTGDAVTLAGSWHLVQSNDVAGVEGAFVEGDGYSLRVLDNRVASGCEAGVLVRGTGNTVNGNVVDAVRTTCIGVEGDGNVVAANRATGSGANALVVYGAQNHVMSNEVAGGDAEGIVLLGDANMLQGNRVHDTADAGIRVAGGNANTLLSNSILRCGGAGFVDEGVGTTLARNVVD